MSSTRKTPVGVAPYRRGGRRGSLRKKPSITSLFIESMPDALLRWNSGKGRLSNKEDSPILGDTSVAEARAEVVSRAQARLDKAGEPLTQQEQDDAKTSKQ